MRTCIKVFCIPLRFFLCQTTFNTQLLKMQFCFVAFKKRKATYICPLAELTWFQLKNNPWLFLVFTWIEIENNLKYEYIYHLDSWKCRFWTGRFPWLIPLANFTALNRPKLQLFIAHSSYMFFQGLILVKNAIIYYVSSIGTISLWLYGYLCSKTGLIQWHNAISVTLNTLEDSEVWG